MEKKKDFYYYILYSLHLLTRTVLFIISFYLLVSVFLKIAPLYILSQCRSCQFRVIGETLKINSIQARDQKFHKEQQKVVFIFASQPFQVRSD